MIDVAIFTLKGTSLSEEAVETVRHFLYYIEVQDGFVLFSDRVVATMEVGDIDEMVERAKDKAAAITGSMSDFAPYNMDDACRLLHMTHESVYAFSPYTIDNDSLKIRQECLEVCEKVELVAVVYCMSEDCNLHVPDI